MTTIEKLSICGIRSYAPQTSVVLKFFKPLTIILGQNGSGKTSIIEALKYSVTGETPPLSERGKTFVHDPNHCGETCVKSQIKVGLRTRDNKAVIAINSMQVTQKKTKLEFKSIDGVVRTWDDNLKQEVSLSHKCGDMKKIIPELMCVSKSILENVIFCHQEESCWPLMEAKKLKEKFDDIFATTRWSKALVNILDYKKKLSLNLKDLNNDLKIIKNNLEISKKINSSLNLTKMRMASHYEKYKKYKLNISEYKKAIEPITDKKKQILEKQEIIKKLTIEAKIFKEQKKSEYDKMTSEYEEDDLKLNEFLNGYKNNINNKKQQLIKFRNEIIDIENKINEIRIENELLIGLKAQIKQKNNDLNNKKLQLNNFIKNNKSININDSNPNIIKNKLLNKQNELKNIKNNKLNIDKEYELKINENEKLIIKYNTNINLLQQQIKDINISIQSINDTINNINKQINNNNSSSNEIQNKLDKTKYDLKLLLQNFNKDSINNELNIYSQNIYKIEKKLNILYKERQNYSNVASILERYNVKKEEYNNIMKKLNDEKNELLLNNNNSNLLFNNNNINENTNNIKNLKNIYDEKLKIIEKEKHSIEIKINEYKQNIAINNNDLKRYNNESKQLKNKILSIENKLQQENLSLNSNLDNLLLNAKENFEHASESVKLSETASIMYEKFINVARKKDSCPVCMRKFDSKEATQNFIAKNENRIKSLKDSNSISKKKQYMQKQKKILQTLETMKNIYDKGKEHEIKLKNNCLQIKKYEENKIILNNKLNEINKKSLVINNKFDNLKLLHKNIIKITHLYNLTKEKELQMNKCSLLVNELNSSNNNKTTLNDIENELDKLINEKQEINNKIIILKKQISNFDNKKQELNDRKLLLMEQLNDFKSKKLRIKTLKDDLINMNNKLNNLNNKINSNKNSLKPINNKINNLKINRNNELNKNNKLINSLELSVNNLLKYYNRIINLNKDINIIENEYNILLNKNKKSFNKISNNKLLITKLNNKKECINKNIIDNTEYITNVSNYITDIEANIKFREVSKKLKDKIQEIKKIKQLILNIGNINLLNNESKKINDLIRENSDNLNKMIGSIESEKLKAIDLMDELNNNKYKNICNRYKEQMIKSHTTLLAIKDLNILYNSIDKSLIKFHSLRMKEINQILKELWQQTYRGNDIDYIQILSSHNNKINKNNNRRIYNYSVVMYQGDSKLNMRGRCSAGQRVLASLLIRLSLAETFCLNCGVLALDEPTTNLDKKNVIALAYALNQIIKRRKGEESFQLICITHDEEFVQLLGQREYCDGFYKVFKNQSGHSRIKLYKFGNDNLI